MRQRSTPSLKHYQIESRFIEKTAKEIAKEPTKEHVPTASLAAYKRSPAHPRSRPEGEEKERGLVSSINSSRQSKAKQILQEIIPYPKPRTPDNDTMEIVEEATGSDEQLVYGIFYYARELRMQLLSMKRPH